MNRNSEIRDPLTHEIIGAAIEVHRNLGPGLVENLYEEAMCIELAARNMKFERQKLIEINYKGHNIGSYRLDLLIEDRVILELKAVKELLPVHEAQLLCYLRVTGTRIGLLINFNVEALKQGIKRLAS